MSSTSMRRTDTPGGVYYADARARVAASELQDGWGFSLPALDAWIEQRGADRAQLEQFRGYMLDAVAAGEARTILPWVLLFTELVRADARERAFAPRAVKQALRARVQGAALKRATAATAVYDEADRARWRELHRSRFSALTKRSAARQIVRCEGLPEAAFEAVRKAL